jgi:hypothetical protein
MELAGYGNEKTISPMSIGADYRQPSIEERLLQQKQRLESNLSDVNAALEALQANPEVLKIMCLISKVNY